MGINRGYRLNRGEGQRKNGRKRGVCPKCGRKGVGMPQLHVPTLTEVSTCRYCGNVESHSIYARLLRDEA